MKLHENTEEHSTYRQTDLLCLHSGGSPLFFFISRLSPSASDCLRVSEEVSTGTSYDVSVCPTWRKQFNSFVIYIVSFRLFPSRKQRVFAHFEFVNMTLMVFFGCAFIAFGPAFALFSLTVAKDAQQVIVLIAR